MNTEIKLNKIAENDKIYNPKTKRYIKIGGRAYVNMVKNNALNMELDNTNKVVYEGETKEEVDRVGDTIKLYENKINPPPPGKYYVQRGNKIIERKKTQTRLELTNDIQKRCLKLYLENKNLFTDDMDKKAVEKILNDLLHKDLMGISTKIKKKSKYKVGKAPDNTFYNLTETDLDTDFSDTEIDTDIE